jgi:hypothetical protein
MPIYRCKKCGTIVVIDPAPSSSNPVKCKGAGTGTPCDAEITSKDVAYDAVVKKYDEVSFAHSARSETKSARVGVDLDDLGFQSVEELLGSTDLAVLQSCAAVDKHLAGHFKALNGALDRSPSKPQVTEIIGETAAALAVAKSGKGKIKMVWGFHLHSGRGIDQIWTEYGGKGEALWYGIVESKGPGASLTVNKFAPDYCATQMSEGWVLDRLYHMQSGSGAAVAKAVLDATGVTLGVIEKNFGGSSTSYYGLDKRETKSAVKLYGVTITATWTKGGPLRHSAVRWQEYSLTKS